MQLFYYVSDYNERLILGAGHEVESFLVKVAKDAVETAKRNIGYEGRR